MAENETQTSWDQISEFKCRNFKASALAQLKGRWTTPVLITLLISVISLVLIGLMFPWKWYINTLLNVYSTESFPMMDFPFARYFLMMIAVVFVTPVLQLAQYYTFAVLYKTKEPISFSDFITGLSFWGKGIGAFWWQYLWLMLWALLGMVPGLVVAIIAGIYVALTGGDSYIIMAIVPFFIYVGVYTVLFIKAYQYSQTEFVLVDNDKIGVIESLNISKAITKGYKWKLFVLDLSFIGWGLLSCIVPIGQLWLIPYMTAAKFSAFRFILTDCTKKAGEKVSAIENKPKAIEEENVVPEVDTTDTNEI